MAALFWTFFAAAVLEGIALILLLALTSGVIFPFLKAKMKGSPLILLMRKDGRTGFITGRYQGGSIETRFGDILVVPGSTTPFYGTMIGIAYEKVGALIPPQFVKAVARLKKANIKNLDQALEQEKQLKDAIEKDELDKDFLIEGMSTDAILSDIVGIKDFFKYSLNPSHIREKVVNAVQYKLGLKDKELMKWAMVLGIVFLIVAISGYILIGKMQCPDYGTLVANAYRTCQQVVNDTGHVVRSAI